MKQSIGLLEDNVRMENLVTKIYCHLSKQEEIIHEKVKQMYNTFSQMAPLSSCNIVTEETNDKPSSMTLEQSQDGENIDDDHSLEENDQKSKRLLFFRDLVENYFRSEGDAISNEQNTLAAPNYDRPVSVNNSNIATRAELKSNVCSLLQDELLQSIQSNKLTQINEYPSSTDIYSQVLPFNSNSNQLDYTALAICKVLHGISSPRWNSKDCYNHWLWGQWRQRLEFEEMNSMVEKMLGFIGCKDISA